MLAIRAARRFQFEVGENLREKEIGAVLAIQRGGVLPEPSKPRLRRPFAFQDRTGIDIDARDGVASTRQSVGDGAGLLQHDLMIVGTERICGDAAAQLRPPIELGRRRRMIRIREADYASQTRIEDSRVQAALRLAREIGHRAMTAVREPFTIELAAVIERTDRRKPDHREALGMRGGGYDLVGM